MSDNEDSGSQLVSLDEAYAVEEIRSHKVVNGVDHYLVKWLGYAEAQNTWEPAENLKTVKNMIDEFMEKFRNAKKEREAARKSVPDPKPKSEQQAGSPQIDNKPQARDKAQDHKDKKLSKSQAKPARTISSSDVSNPGNDKKKAPPPEDKLNEHFKNTLKDAKPAPKKKPEEKERENGFSHQGDSREEREPKQSKDLREPREQRESKVPQLRMEEEVVAIHSSMQVERPEGAPSKKPRLTEETATQEPEHQIKKIHHVTVRNDEIYYQVEYARRTDQKINILHSNIVMRENPAAIAEFYQQRLLMMPEDTTH